jgi:hypothetical protein
MGSALDDKDARGKKSTIQDEKSGTKWHTSEPQVLAQVTKNKGKNI